jgi:hypothetical protein
MAFQTQTSRMNPFFTFGWWHNSLAGRIHMLSWAWGKRLNTRTKPNVFRVFRGFRALFTAASEL